MAIERNQSYCTLHGFISTCCFFRSDQISLEDLEHSNLNIGIGWDGISQTRLGPKPSDGDISESEIQESADALLEDFVLVKLALISTSAAGGEEISLVSHSFTTTTHQFTEQILTERSGIALIRNNFSFHNI